MAWRNGAPLALRAFRRAGSVVVKMGDGTVVQGRGLVSALRGETGEPDGKRHPLGSLPRPLYRFTGFLPEAEQAVGGVLTQENRAYTVLDARKIVLGERELCVRALLERREDEA